MNKCLENNQPYDEMLSAAIDGELDGAERDQLNRHLKICSFCRGRMDSFREVDQWAVVPINWNKSNVSQPAVAPDKLPETVQQPAFRWRWWYSAISMAAVLALAIAGRAILMPGEEVADPLAPSLNLIEVMNEQTQQDQQTMLEMLELKLRAMHLEAKNADLTPEESREMEQKIQRLFERIKKTGTDVK